MNIDLIYNKLNNQTLNINETYIKKLIEAYKSKFENNLLKTMLNEFELEMSTSSLRELYYLLSNNKKIYSNDRNKLININLLSYYINVLDSLERLLHAKNFIPSYSANLKLNNNLPNGLMINKLFNFNTGYNFKDFNDLISFLNRFESFINRSNNNLFVYNNYVYLNITPFDENSMFSKIILDGITFQDFDCNIFIDTYNFYKIRLLTYYKVCKEYDMLHKFNFNQEFR